MVEPATVGRSPACWGVVEEQRPDALFTVRLDGSNRRIVAHAAGSPRRNFVRLLPGDRVMVELTARNRSRGRIIRRDEVGGPGSAPHGEPSCSV